MASITSLGVGSGLDITGLVSQLVKAEGDPATARLTNQKQQATAELSALGTLKSSLSSLQTSLKGLSALTGFQATKVTSSNETLFMATGAANTSAGQYQIEVSRLAQRHKLASDTFTSTDTFGGSGGDQLAISAGGSSFNVDLSTAKTLSEIRDDINSATDNPGITATLLQVDATHQVLMFNAADTGSANAITVTETLAASASLSFDIANRDAATGLALANTDTDKLDAEVKVDGITVNRGSNQLTDVIDGLTINLRKAEVGTAATLDVSRDLTSAATAVADFVTKYNASLDTLRGVSGFKGVGATQPALYGDSVTRGITSRLRAELGDNPTGLTGAFASLSEIGITTGTDGKLTLNSTKLDTAIAKDLAGVGELFASTDGFATRIGGLLDSYLETGGTLDSRTQGVRERLDRIGVSQDALDRRLAAIETRYKKQFTAMDALVGQLNSTSSFLSQQFTALSNLTKSK